MKTLEEIQKENERYTELCRSVFLTGLGKELLAQLKKIYVEGRLFHDSERTTIYAIAQRDFVLELEAQTIVEPTKYDPEEIGEEIET